MNLDKFSELQSKVLVLIAKADNNFDENELQFYNDMIKASPIDDIKMDELLKYPGNDFKIEDILNELKDLPLDFTLIIIKNSYLMAQRNGIFKDKEKAILDSIAYSIGLLKENQDEFYKMLEKYYESYLIEKNLFNH
jgi:hypothetical protein